ncbi:MAG: SAM-dependent methyltransferase [Kiritimatiellae bacterium]|nr:SAM-dependent methyltransferase [Kiritimatiellia bacterium]
MERYELEEALQEEIRAKVFSPSFMKLVQSCRRGGGQFRISLRPVSIGGVVKYQAEMVNDGQVQVKNFDREKIAGGLEEIIAQKGARDLHLMTKEGDLHIRVTKKSHVLVSRSKAMNREFEVKPHDRVKNLPLNSFDSAAYLRVVGFADGEGKIRASMRGKYDQVNEFLKVVGELEPKKPDSGVFTIVDCGCGKAYLTLGLYFYLTRVWGIDNVKIYGVDRRQDVIEAARKMAKALDVENEVVFIQSDLADFTPAETLGGEKGSAPKVEMVVSLHACDTATDEAIAKGVEWRSRYILSAPCCQHELQKRLGEMSGKSVGAAASFGGLLRQSILRERLCDILTDSFRAMILRILGFKTQVMEFVSSEATARNIMLKAEYGVKPGQTGPVGEYLALRDFWEVEPWLEARLGAKLAKYLERYT